MKSAETIRQTIDTIVGRPQLPPQLDPGLVDDLPESPGAYALFGKDGELLKVKRASNLRQQILAHFSSDNGNSTLARDTWRIDWRETAGEFGARLGELEFAEATRKPQNELCAWHLEKHGEGDFRPELVFARDTNFSTTPDLFGLYLSRREAVVGLRKLVEAHHLCHTLSGIGTARHGEACIGFKQKSCRGACVGKEPVSAHSARLMMALARHKIADWPFPGPVALVERDEFGMREEFHLVDRWRHLGTVQSEHELHERLASPPERPFDPEIYRILGKAIRSGKLRIVHLP